MRNHTVEIGDIDGNSFKIFVSTPNLFGSVIDNTGNWGSIGKVLIKINNGVIKRRRSEKDSTLSDLLICFKSNEGWGICLWDYEDLWVVNDYGVGSIAQTWCIKMKPGDISWTLLD